MVFGEISVRNASEAAFVRFCLLQKMDDIQVIVQYDDRQPRYSVGIVATDEDLPHVDKVMRTLDFFEVYYETDFDLPTT